MPCLANRRVSKRPREGLGLSWSSPAAAFIIADYQPPPVFFIRPFTPPLRPSPGGGDGGRVSGAGAKISLKTLALRRFRNADSGGNKGLAGRKPLLLFLLSGLLLLRLAERQLLSLLFHEPPRRTRFVPLSSLRLDAVVPTARHSAYFTYAAAYVLVTFYADKFKIL